MGLYEPGPCEWCGNLIYPAVPRIRWAPYGLKAINADSGSVHYCEPLPAAPVYMDERNQSIITRPPDTGIMLDWSEEYKELPSETEPTTVEEMMKLIAKPHTDL